MATILTNAGRTKLLAATPMTPVTLSHVAFGDGSGVIPPVLATRTALVNERIRVAASVPIKDNTDQTIIAVSGLVPRTFGGATLREVGLFDNTNTLIAYGSIENVVVPTPTTEYGFTYLGVIRVKLDNTTMTTVINSDAPAFDHRGLTFRDEPDAHPALAIAMSQAGRTVQSMFNLVKIISSNTTLLVGEDNILTTNSTQTLPSTAGLTIGSRVTVKKYSSIQATIQVNNTTTEQIRIGNNSVDAADYDSILFNSNRDLHFTWTGTVWECSY